MVFPGPLGWVGKIANGSTEHRKGQSDTAFSWERAYETILTLTFTKQALRSSPPESATKRTNIGHSGDATSTSRLLRWLRQKTRV